MKQSEKESALLQIDMMLKLHSGIHLALEAPQYINSPSYHVYNALMNWKAEIEAIEVENPQSRSLDSIDKSTLQVVWDCQRNEGFYIPIKRMTVTQDRIEFLVDNGYLNWNAPKENADRVYITDKGKRVIGIEA